MEKQEIKLIGLNLTFPVNNIVAAIEKACEISQKEAKPVEISLPAVKIPVKDAIIIKGDVILKGLTKTKLFFGEFGIMKIEGKLTLSELCSERTRNTFLPTFIITGQMIANNTIFTNTLLLSQTKGSVIVEQCSFNQNGKPKCDNFALVFKSSGEHIMKNCKIMKYGGGIHYNMNEKETGKLQVNDSKFHTQFYGIYIINSDCSLINNSFSVKSKNAILIEGDRTNATLSKNKNCKAQVNKKISEDMKTFNKSKGIYKNVESAYKLYTQNTKQSLVKCESMLTNISLWLEYLPELKTDGFMGEVAKSLEISMFLATFKTKNNNSTILNKKEVVKSWELVKDVLEFDKVLVVITDMLSNLHLTEKEFDFFFKSLESLRIELFKKVKIDKQQQYLTELSKINPLRFWYVISSELPKTQTTKNMRTEIFFNLLNLEKEEKNVHKRICYRWIFQWGCHSMGTYFKQEALPGDITTRIAWSDTLMDNRCEQTILDWYEMLKGSTNELSCDKGIQFEANFRLKNVKDLKHRWQYKQMMTKLLKEDNHGLAMEDSIRNFPGYGPLPGYVRRMTEHAKTVEEVMKALRPGYDVANVGKEQKQRFCLAVLDNFYLNVKPQSKIVPKRKETYDTCSICFCRKLFPWDKLSLGECNQKHTFCLPCFGESMSTGSRNLWGICPGKTKSGKQCRSIANRREMELAGMKSDKIYNIIQVRIDSSLENKKDWQRCPICNIGGATENKLSYFVCHLCGSTITKKGDEHDFTIKINLLKGLESSKSRRGQGVFRECFHCSAPYEKGNACSTITCAKCTKQYNMTWGPKNINHSYDDSGVGAQRYVPKAAGTLWNLGVFKRTNGQPLQMGQEMTEQESNEVIRRAREVANKLKQQ